MLFAVQAVFSLSLLIANKLLEKDFSRFLYLSFLAPLTVFVIVRTKSQILLQPHEAGATWR